jgi:hypothetical protein
VKFCPETRHEAWVSVTRNAFGHTVQLDNTVEVVLCQGAACGVLCERYQVGLLAKAVYDHKY